MESPLAEAKPAAMDELFNREPTELSDSDITAMVVELRKQRVNWQTLEAVKKNKPAKISTADKAAINDLLADL